MRLLHVIHTLDPKMGGPVESVRQLAMQFIKRGHSVEVLSAADVAADPWTRDFAVPIHPAGPAWGQYAWSPRVARWLRAHLREYDAVIINGLWQSHVGTASRICRRYGVPYFVYAHGLMDPWNRRAHPLRYLKKLLYWLLVERHTLEAARGIVFASSEEARLAARYFPWSDWSPIVVGSGIDFPPEVTPAALEQFFARFPAARGRRLWLFLSRIHQKKGLENLVDAMREMAPGADPPLLLVVGAGEPGYVNRLKRRALELERQGRILWTGPLYGDSKWAVFEAAEVFVLPSHQENFGIAIAEALAMGLPSITTTRVNIWRDLQESNAGLIVGDSRAEVRAALEQWEGLGEEARARMSEAARRCFRENFWIATAAERLFGAIEAARTGGD